MSKQGISLSECVTALTFGHVEFICNLKILWHFRESHCFIFPVGVLDKLTKIDNLEQILG